MIAEKNRPLHNRRNPSRIRVADGNIESLPSRRGRSPGQTAKGYLKSAAADAIRWTATKKDLVSEAFTGVPLESLDSFQYSNALKNSKIKWTEDTLNKWLTDTEKLVPNNDMAFHIEKADERSEIIAYLKQNSGQ